MAGQPTVHFRRHAFLLLAAVLIISLSASFVSAQCGDPAQTRPILFVHGIWENSNAWGTTKAGQQPGIRDHIITKLEGTYGYPLNSKNYDLYFDGNSFTVRWAQTPGTQNPQSDPIAGYNGNIPCDARFFSIIFSSWGYGDVAKVSVITKAYELSEVIKAITGITFVKDVIVIAHSLGALDARVYLEGLGSEAAPCISDPCISVGSLKYTGDVGHLITLDGANAGVAAGNILGVDVDYWLVHELNVAELEFNSDIIQAVNYNRSYTDANNKPVNANTLPAELSIDALINEYSDYSVECVLSDSETCTTDGILSSDSQSITIPLQGFPNVYDLANGYQSTDPTITQNQDCWFSLPPVPNPYTLLHLLPCLSDPHNVVEQAGDVVYDKVRQNTSGQLTSVNIQTTYNGGQTYTGAINLILSVPGGSTTITDPQAKLSGPSVPPSPQLPSVPPQSPTAYSLAWSSGGPQGASQPTITGYSADGTVCSPSNCYITSGISPVAAANWGLTFSVNFAQGAPTSPTVTTAQATGVTGDSATLGGTVNPNGGATTAWFEWGPITSLGYSTAKQFVGSGTATMQFLAVLPGLASNTTYYYRIDANSGGNTQPGSIVPFATLATLPAPSLLAPANGASNIAPTPTFSWTSVTGASSYRLIVATSPGALPSDPTSPTCGAGCILDVTPSGTTYTPLNGILQAGTTYYWEVHARSPLQYGTWSSIFSLATVGSAVNGLSVSPTTVLSGATATVMVTLDGPAPGGGAQVTLSSSNAAVFPTPSVVSVAAGASTGSVSVVAGTVSVPTTVTVTGTYGGFSASNSVTVSTSGGSGVVLSSFSISPSTIVGGYSPQGNVFLTGPAPAGGAVVNLSSNNPHFVQVPPSQTVTVQPGYTSAGFPITTSFTSGTVGATVTASYNNTMYGAGLTVLPVAASGVTFYPSTVNAGDSAPLIVYLTGPAAAGTSVSLVSSNPSVLQVPSSVNLNTGATQVSITGTTFAVGAQTNVTVTASYNGSSGQGTLTVVPVPPLLVNTFNFSPSTVTGGANASGQVTLTGLAPAGGVNVALSTSSQYVQPPASVYVPEGDWYANVSVPTSAVGAIINTGVTASYNGSQQNASLTLVPPLPYLATLSFSPATVQSGSSTVGTITLTAPAPLGGACVSLNSTWGFIVPGWGGNCTDIPAGSTSGTFNVTTPPIAFVTTVTVTATYNGTTLNTLLTVVPPGTPFGPSSLTLNPMAVTGGASATGNFLFTYPAPAGGATLQLSSDNPEVQVSPSISVPAGATSAQFPVTTSSVAVISTATVTVSSNGIFQSSLLTLRPSGSPPLFNPVPFLGTPIIPPTQTPGGAGSTLTLTGSGFVPGALALWNGTVLPTTFQSNTQLQASVPARDIQTNGTAFVTVTNPGAENVPSNGLPEHLSYSVAAPSFNSSAITDIAGGGTNAVAADLNRDGKADLIIGGFSVGGLAIFLGNGDGTFGSALILEDVQPSSFIVADFNGDGKPDIAAVSWNGNTNGSNLVHIFLGNGDGTFTSAPDVVFSTSLGSVTSLAAADLNGDGYLDLVVTGNYLTQAYVLLGNGDGTFGVPAGFGSVNQPFGVAVADFDGDGRLDLALTDTGNQAVAILLGNGNGTFQSQIEYSAGGYPYALSVADFSRDGHPDIAIATEGYCCGNLGGLAVLRNNGNGTFASPVNYGAGQEYDSVATDDLNGDGKLDLFVIGSSYQAALLYLGNGDGTFATNPISIPMGQNAYSVAIADLNGDGAPDIVAPNQINATGNITILLQSVAPVLQVTPSSLSFSATQGEGAPPSQSLAIANTGGGTETWAAASSQSWTLLGQTSGTVPSTLSVSVNPAGLNPGTYTATITVTAAGASNSPQTVPVTLVVNPTPVVISSLTLSPAVLVGPGSSTGTVALSGSAPVGGASVSLGSNSSAVQVPSGVTILAGQTSTTFTATASAVTTQTVATVTATYNGGSASTTLTVNPNTLPLTVSPTALSYGNQGISSTSAAKKVTLTNNTGAVVTISSTVISGTDTADFTQSTTTCGKTLALKKSCTISITFTPTALGARSAMLILTDSAVNSPQTVALSGTGVLQVSLSPTALAFGNQADGSSSAPKNVTLTNNTSTALPISSVATTGTNSGEFAVSSNTCGASVGGHSSCKISVTFEPVTPGAKTASLTITDSANNSPQSVSLTGTGIAPVSVTPSSLTSAAQKVGTTSPAKKITVKNNLKTTLTFSGITVTGANAGDFAQSGPTCGGTLGAGLTCTVSITFTPTAKGSRVATLNISDNAITSPQTVALSGTGK